MAEKHFVYVIKGVNGNRKIGVTKNIKDRLATLQTGNYKRLLLESVVEFEDKESAFLVERDCHRLLGDCLNGDSSFGEWYAIGPHSAKNLVCNTAKKFGRAHKLTYLCDRLTMTKEERIKRERKLDSAFAKARKARKVRDRNLKDLKALASV